MGVEQIINNLVTDLLLDANSTENEFAADEADHFPSADRPDFSFAKSVNSKEMAEETSKAGSSTIQNLLGIKEIMDMMGINVGDLLQITNLEGLEDIAQNIAKQFSSDLARFLAEEVTDRAFGGGGGRPRPMGGMPRPGMGMGGMPRPGMGMGGGPGMGMGAMGAPGGGMGGLAGMMGFKPEDGGRFRKPSATTFKGGKLKSFFLFRWLKKLYYCFGLHKLWVKVCVKFFQLERCAKFAFARLVKALPCLIFEFIFDLIALSVIVCLCCALKPKLFKDPDTDTDTDGDDTGGDDDDDDSDPKDKKVADTAKAFTEQFKHTPEQVEHLFGLKRDDNGGKSPFCIVLAIVYALWLFLLKVIIILLVAFICCLKSFKRRGYGYGGYGGYGYGGYGCGGGCGYRGGCGGCC